MKIRKRLILYFLIVVLIVVTVSSTYIFSTTGIILKVRALFRENILLDEIMVKVDDTQSLLTLYLFSRNDDLLEEISVQTAEIKGLSRDLPNNITNDQYILQKKNIRNMLGSYTEGILNVLQHSQQDAQYDVTNDYEKIDETARLINISISDLLIEVSINNATQYVNTLDGLQFVTLLGLLLLEAALFTNLVLISKFAVKISRPIEQLTFYSTKVAGGDYETEMMRISSKDEMGELAHSIQSMVSSLKISILEVKENARITNLLQEQEYKNEQMKSLLVIARQEALQSQVNPHFLYNSLNAAAQLAILEGAAQTGDYLQVVSALFRYNLSNSEGFVTLKEELEHVFRYIAIQKTRFQDNITFTKAIDEGTLKTPLPRMILQPIVENCFSHAFENMKKGCKISINCFIQGKKACVEIVDNGQGMTQEKIDEILKLDNRDKEKNGKSARIGMQNIVERLRIAYKHEDVIDIVSSNAGTTIRIVLPLQEDRRW